MSQNASQKQANKFEKDQEMEERFIALQALYDASQTQNARYKKELRAIQEASAAISAELNVNEVLSFIATKAATAFNAPATSVMLWDDGRENLIIKAAYGLDETYRDRQKIARSVVDEFIAEDVIVPRIFPIGSMPLGDQGIVQIEGLHSVLAAPLTNSDGGLNGVLNIYSKSEEKQFTDNDMELAAIFANHASIAIQNAKRYEDLRQIKGYVGSHTALEWMKMVRSNWNHEISGKVGLAKTITYTIEKALGQESDRTDKVRIKIIELESMLDDIAKTRLLEPLASETEVSSIMVNESIQKYIDAKDTQSHLADINFEFDPLDGLDEFHTVRASRAWLRRLFDIIVDNAINAMWAAEMPHKVITFATQIINGNIHISITNTGPEILGKIKAQMFQRPIEKARGELGTGMGLMEARAIVETYGGRIWYDSESEQTKFIVSFPTE